MLCKFYCQSSPGGLRAASSVSDGRPLGSRSTYDLGPFRQCLPLVPNPFAVESTPVPGNGALFNDAFYVIDYKQGCAISSRRN
jgi:hypothetical protein